jgi:hypothetical protein
MSLLTLSFEDIFNDIVEHEDEGNTFESSLIDLSSSFMELTEEMQQFDLQEMAIVVKRKLGISTEDVTLEGAGEAIKNIGKRIKAVWDKIIKAITDFIGMIIDFFKADVRYLKKNKAAIQKGWANPKATISSDVKFANGADKILDSMVDDGNKYIGEIEKFYSSKSTINDFMKDTASLRFLGVDIIQGSTGNGKTDSGEVKKQIEGVLFKKENTETDIAVGSIGIPLDSAIRIIENAKFGSQFKQMLAKLKSLSAKVSNGSTRLQLGEGSNDVAGGIVAKDQKAAIICNKIVSYSIRMYNKSRSLILKCFKSAVTTGSKNLSAPTI